MRAMLLQVIIGAIMKELQKTAPDLLKGFVDNGLDYVETYVLGTKSEVDDAVILPLCGMLRETFGIPDNDA